MTTYQALLEFFRAFGTPIAAAIGAWVAYRFGTIQAQIASQQAKTARDAAITARNKLRMDMYDIRLEIYSTVMALLSQLAITGKLTQADENAFLGGLKGVRWVFGSDLDEFLTRNLWHAVVDFMAAQNSFNESEEQSLRAQMAEAKHARRTELLGMREDIERRFAEYMDFERPSA